MAINSHVQIPAQILKKFRDESDPEKKVWYLDISSGRIYKTAASKLGTSKGYYSMAGEDFWSRSLESPLGALNKKIRTFCESGTERVIVTSEDIDLVKRYIKAAAIRSDLAYKAMREESITASMFSEQDNHDALSFFGMNINGEFDYWIEDLSLAIVVNKTNRYLVVPRNCYYCVPRNQMPNFVVPISPKGALLLLPIEEVQKNDGGCAVIDDPMQIELLNVFALKYEYMFNADFVASNCRKELEILKDYQEKNKVVLNALRTVNR